MIYNSVHFILFFPLIFSLYYVIPHRFLKIRNLYLLLVSYIIYAQWCPAHLLVLVWVSLITYIAALFIESIHRINLRKFYISISVFLSLIPLLAFKYYNFINESTTQLLTSIGLKFYLPGLNWMIPIGISFFTFQAVGYLFDVYYKRIKPERKLIDYLLFVSFFPSIVSGPISKASSLLPQIKSLRPYFCYEKAVHGLKFLLWGMFLKVVVADRVTLYVDSVYDNYTSHSGLTCLVASIFYSIQIYSDFAGYSLMALGTGKLLGFDLPLNFNRPYFSVSVTDFWRRWHITLSVWLRDCVYIPLGGNRCSKLKNYWNIFITFLVSGIWHGANWTFVVWGVIHGMAQITEKILGLHKDRKMSLLHVLTTFFIVNLAWIFFRLPTISDALNVICKIFTFDKGLSLYRTEPYHTMVLLMFGITILFLKDLTDEFCPNRFNLLNNHRPYIRWCTYLFLLVCIILAGSFDATQFIYSSF